MNRSQFELVYIHANSLVDLAIDGLAQDLASGARHAAPEPAPTADERDEQVRAMLGRMAPAASLDEWLGGADFDAEVMRAFEQLAAPAPHMDGEAHADLAADLTSYLARAYAARPQIAAAVDQAMARIDSAAVERLLDGAGGLAPLAQPLRADELAQWLARYEAGDAALEELITLVRSVAVNP